MRRQFVGRAARSAAGDGLHLSLQIAQLPLQCLDLFLLAVDRMVQGIEQVLGIGQLDFKFVDACFQVLTPKIPSR